ncbi:hypothetical protein CSQ79_05265 [Gloeocapsopsis sp. IPPAS B-1203]|nr:hypothetical protein CSQ79_05265 [Gloeocapsopsis sp. IPPAS B-1203]
MTPVEGKANAELIKIFSENFKTPKTNIKIKSSIASRQKNSRNCCTLNTHYSFKIKYFSYTVNILI